MSNREFTEQRTMLANAMATAGAELLEYMGVSSALAAIPNTEPQQYVVAGTLAMIGKLLPKESTVPPLTAPAPLTDEQRIFDLAAEHEANRDGLYGPVTFDATGLVDFARAIEREVRAKAAPAAPVKTAEKPHDLTIREAFDAVGGWMNGGEMGYPSFGSFEALSIYTTKMIRSFLANKAWHEGLAAPVQAEQAQAEPVGWKLVPVEATPAMYEANVLSLLNGDDLRGTWAAMVAAAPALPAQAEQAAAVRAAYENAARICDSVNNHDNPMTAKDCADVIRALAAPSTATSNDTAALGDIGGAK